MSLYQVYGKKDKDDSMMVLVLDDVHKKTYRIISVKTDADVVRHYNVRCCTKRSGNDASSIRIKVTAIIVSPPMLN